MARAEISGISPFFLVSHVPSALAFYRERLGFEVAFEGPTPDDGFELRDADGYVLFFGRPR